MDEKTKNLLKNAETQRTKRGREARSRERAREARRLVSACGAYSVPGPGGGAFIDPEDPDSDLVFSERTRRNSEWPRGNEEFCERWVRKYWVPAVQPLLALMSVPEIEVFSPEPPTPVSGYTADLEHARLAIEISKRLFLDLVKGTAPAKVIRDVIEARLGLGPGRYQLSLWFEALATALEAPPARGTEEVQTTGPSDFEFKDRPEVMVPVLTFTKILNAKRRPAVIKGRTAAPLAAMVMSQPDHDHTWKELSAAGIRTGRWRTDPKSLERVGRRVRDVLPPSIRHRWEQSGSGVRWRST